MKSVLSAGRWVTGQKIVSHQKELITVPKILVAYIVGMKKEDLDMLEKVQEDPFLGLLLSHLHINLVPDQDREINNKL